jgi:hypothetical protein
MVDHTFAWRRRRAYNKVPELIEFRKEIKDLTILT